MPKCAFCGKELKKKEAYVVNAGKINKYYCNYEHSIAVKPRDRMYDLINEIFGYKVLNTVLFKECDEVGKVQTYEKVVSYLQENKQYLEQVMTREFANEYNKIRYFSAILKNSLVDYQMPKKEVEKEVEIEMYEPVKKVYKSQRKGLDELMEDLLDE